MNDQTIPSSSECWRFVDGELNPEQESAFLASCEAEPDRYRELALALVERKRLTEMLAGFHSHIDGDQALPDTQIGCNPNRVKSKTDSKSTTKWVALPTIAAILLFGIF